jgi:regulator of protease activity HflC (stomatin/prohibitin superfamily)
MKENTYRSLPGIPMLLLLLVATLAGAWLIGTSARDGSAGWIAGIAMVLGAIFLMLGLYKVEPNQAAVLDLFGKYVGTVKDNGLRWNNPFYGKKKVSLRVRNFESSKLKVNELDGSPIEIAAVIVWQVVDSAEAVYNVDDYESFVHIQSESAVRTMATSYPYDQHEEGQLALRSHAAEVSKHLMEELQERLADAGVKVLDSRISHLAYAPEIGMVEMALAELQKNGVVQLDEERKAQMVSNLLVVLCGERSTQPIVNAGSLY